MMNKTTNDRGQSNARARSFDPVKLLRFSLFTMLLMLCGGSMWAGSVTTWVKTDPTALTTNDVVVIVDQTSGKAMEANGTSAPKATGVTLKSDKSEITSGVIAAMQFKVTIGTTKVNNVDTRSYQFGYGTDYLYCTASNNGVRVGTNNDNVFIIKKADANSEEDFIFNTTQSRYLGVYSNQDWRCYTTVNNNIKGTVTAFYKKVVVESADAPDAPTFSPAAGTYYTGQYVEISCTTEGATIKKSLDGENFETYSEALPVTSTTTVYAYAELNGEKSETVSAKYVIGSTYDSFAPMQEAAAAEGFSNKAIQYRATGGMVVAYVNGNNAYLIDGSGNGILAYNKDGLGELAAGQKMNYDDGYLTATLENYQGNAELTGIVFPEMTGGTVTVTPVEKTLPLTSANQSTLVTLKGLTYNSSDQTFGDGTNTIKFYDKFKTNVVLENGKAYDVTGIVVLYNDVIEISPRTANDISEIITTAGALNAAAIAAGEEEKAVTFNFTNVKVVYAKYGYYYLADNDNSGYALLKGSQYGTEADMTTGSLITGTFTGTVSAKNGTPQASANSFSLTSKTADPNPRTPTTITIDQLGNNVNNYIKIENAELVQRLGNDITFKVGETTFKAYNSFALNVTLEEGKAYDIIGFGNYHAAPGNPIYYQILPTEITEATPAITVAKPVISGGFPTFYTEKTVAITCETEGATIYYTTDGSVPTAESTLYTEPFTINASCTIKAIAIMDNVSSEVAEMAFIKYVIHDRYIVVGDENTPLTADENFKMTFNEEEEAYEYTLATTAATTSFRITTKIENSTLTPISINDEKYDGTVELEEEYDLGANETYPTINIAGSGIYLISVYDPGSIIITKTGDLSPFYILGDPTGWGLPTNMTEMPWNVETQAYEYTFTTTGTSNFCFSETNEINENDWTTFNSNYRYGNGIGNFAADEYINSENSITLSKIGGDGNIQLNTAGEWTISVTADKKLTITGEATPVTPTEDTYVVAGGYEGNLNPINSFDPLLGTRWDEANENNKMTKQDNGTYKLEIENATLYKGTYEFKIVNGDSWIPANNIQQAISETGIYNAVFTFYPENAESSTLALTKQDGDITIVAAGGFSGEDAGLENVLFTTTWQASLDANKLTELEDGTFTMVYEKVALPAATIEYKIVINGDDWVGDSQGANLTYAIAEAGNYDVTVTYNPITRVAEMTAVAAEEPVAGDVTATWDFTSNANPRAVGLFNGTTGTLDSNVAGIVLDIDARNGKFDSQDRTSDAQVNSGTIIKVPIKGAGDEVTVVGNWKVSYTIGSEAEAVTDLKKTYTATAADAQQGHVTITSTDNNTYFYSITVVQKATSGEEEEIEGLLYSWESPNGTVKEKGGTATAKDKDGADITSSIINKQTTTGLYTIKVDGKADYTSGNVIIITLDKKLHAGDIISVTGCRDKNETGKATGFKAKFDKGGEVASVNGTDFVNVNAAVSTAEEYSSEPNTCKFTVPEAAEGSKVITITRSHTSTNLWISKLVITTEVEDDPNAVETPVITPATGTYGTEQEVTITCETDDATIYYTTDGNDPTAESTEYTEAFTVTETTTIKAIAIKGEYSSEIAESVITIVSVEPGTSDLEWDYTEAAPTENPDPDAKGNYLYYGAKSTAPTGVKLNSTGYAFFAKNPVEGKLTLTFGLKSGTGAYAVNVYACKITDGEATKGDPIGEISVDASPGTGSLDIPAAVTGIYIERKSTSEGVLQKIVFKEKVARTFKDFEITNEELKGTYDPSGLPQGVEFSGTPHNDSHGYQNVTLKVPTDGGAVKFTIGGCYYANPATFDVKNSNGDVVATIDEKTSNCYHQKDTDISTRIVTYIYTGEATTLTFGPISYLPYFKAEAVEVEEVTVTYKDQNGTILGEKKVIEGDAIGESPCSEADLTIPEGEKFRGWTYTSGVKVKDTDVVTGNTTVLASVTPIETATVGSIQTYDLTSSIFYPEDHETFDVDGAAWHDGQHGFVANANQSISVQTAGKAQVVVTLCQYSSEGTVTVKDANGNPVGEGFNGHVTSCGETAVVNYDGEATWLTFTFAATTYIHNIKVYNVENFIEKDEATGWYILTPGDAAGLVLALNAAASEPNSKIFLPNGTYDLGQATLTTISGQNVSIIGESMEGVIIKNAPPTSAEGLGKADLFTNTSEGLYLQDLTLQNGFPYTGNDGRAPTLHDMGTKTINKNVRHLSYQDTYYSHKTGGLYYFEGGEIHGTVDYLCGDGKVYFNGVKLVNEERSSATVTANSELYVFNNCVIENNADKYNFGRAWSNNPVCIWLNTTLMDPDKLISTRWNLTGINCDYSIAGEYGTKNAEGTDITPESNNVTFTKNNTQMNTILSADQAATYTINYVLGDWAATAQAQATQVAAPKAELKDGVITWTPANDGATAYAIFKDGKFLGITTESSWTVEEAAGAPRRADEESQTTGYTIRAANSRGGFGPAADVSPATGIAAIEAELGGDVKIYDLNGRRVMTPTKGVYIINGRKVVIK